MEVSVLIPSRNGQEFLEWSYNSIRNNQGTHLVEILVLDDISDKDNTWDWCLRTMETDINFKAFRNDTNERLGISSGYKFLSKEATKEVICHWHNDMFMTEGTLDEVEQYLYDFEFPKRWKNVENYGTPNEDVVVCLTRIEPPIYNKAGLYPEKIIWNDAPIDLQDWDEQKFIQYLPKAIQLWGEKQTGGHFAPFFMFREEYLNLGGNDTINFPKQAREDSDFAFRLVLAGFETIQIPVFCYHFASRGNRRSKHESGNFVDNPAWVEININSTRNFIRKWGTMNLHDENLKPNKPVKYNVGFVVKNCNINLLSALEIWCDKIVTDLPYDQTSEYIGIEQPNTKYRLTERIVESIGAIPDVVVEIDGQRFNQNDYNVICNLSDILTDSGDIGEFELGNLKLNIKALTHYENNLIKV